MPQQVPSHTPQACPRCHQSFVCKASDVGACQCSAIRLNKEQSAFINQQYATCLCINCLQEMKQLYEKQAIVSIE